MLGVENFLPIDNNNQANSYLPLANNQTASSKPVGPITDVAANTATEPESAPPAVRRGWLIAIAALLIAYAALSYYSESSAHVESLAAALSIGPVLLIGLLLLWRWTKPLTALLAAALLGACLFRYWTVIEKNYRWADLVQQCGIYALITWGFARSLFAGRVPLCTQLAAKMHGALTPIEIAYTRRATVAWAVFYLLMSAAILVLFFAAAPSVWSFFVNFVTFVLIVLMGLADHAIRRRVLPRHPAGGILAIIRRSISG
jgi:uncharacterized membrane protein